MSTMITSYHACLSVYTLCFRSVEIETTVTRDAAVADAWVRGLRASHPCGAPFIVGLDCKWNKQPTRSPAWMAPKSAVFQLLYLRRVLEILREFLRDPRVQLVGVGVVEGVVEAADHGLVCAAPVELAGPCDAYLGLVGRDKLGLKEYAKKVLDLNMEKPESVGMSDWEKYDLSMCQIGYACVDAYVSYRLGEKVLLGR
jgi:hypothetical protein